MNTVNTNTDQAKYYHSSSFYTCAFLIAKGSQLITIEHSQNSNQRIFVLKDTTDGKLLHCFNFAPEDAPEVMVDGRKLIASIRQLKTALYEEGTRP